MMEEDGGGKRVMGKRGENMKKCRVMRVVEEETDGGKGGRG